MMSNEDKIKHLEFLIDLIIKQHRTNNKQVDDIVFEALVFYSKHLKKKQFYKKLPDILEPSGIYCEGKLIKEVNEYLDRRRK